MAFDLPSMAAGLGAGMCLVAMAGIVLIVLEGRMRRNNRRGMGRDGMRAVLLAAPLRPGHPWSVPEDPGKPRAAGGAAGSGAGVERPFDEGARDATDPCAGLRATVDARCGHAEHLRAVATQAKERLAVAQRAYGEHAARRDAAQADADPRRVRVAKDAAQAEFHKRNTAAKDATTRDGAATAWLHEINAINRTVREASAILVREAAAEAGLMAAVERAGNEADGARLAARRAADACHDARVALATCDEHGRAGAPAGEPTVPAARGRRAVRPRAIGRLLQGDHATMTAIVDAVAGPDPAARGRWQLLLSDFVDAVVSRAIDATSFEFPDRHVFWGSLPPAERREVAAVLAAMGFRFDGLGGFADGRVPKQRDLTLAVARIGLQPAQLRPWPADADLPLLYRKVRVDAAGFVDAVAGGLTLGEMIDLLGQRAEPLAELWNSWGRIRPLLADD